MRGTEEGHRAGHWGAGLRVPLLPTVCCPSRHPCPSPTARSPSEGAEGEAEALMCECCWSASAVRRMYGPDEDDAYRDTLKEHQERGCICTKDSLEGRRAVAGQWWDEATGRDSRETTT